jgi:hypothetical protein
MRNLFLLFLGVTFASTTFAQKGWDISAGATVFAPIAKNVNWDSKFWGQRVTFTKKSVNVTLGYMQNKAGNAQIPVLVGTEKGLGKVFKVGLRGGMTFFNGKEGQFTYMPSIRYEVKKKWCVEQSLLRTVKDGKHASQVGLAVLYHL